MKRRYHDNDGKVKVLFVHPIPGIKTKPCPSMGTGENGHCGASWWVSLGKMDGFPKGDNSPSSPPSTQRKTSRVYESPLFSATRLSLRRSQTRLCIDRAENPAFPWWGCVFPTASPGENFKGSSHLSHKILFHSVLL